MAVLILHPTEELIFAKLQKELISEYYVEGRILYAVTPLWIPLNGSFDTVFGPLNRQSHVEPADLQATATEIFVPVTITAADTTIKTKLELIRIHSGKEFTESEQKNISQKKQPVKQLKVFRLGIEKELSSNSKCITESKWIKIK